MNDQGMMNENRYTLQDWFELDNDTIAHSLKLRILGS